MKRYATNLAVAMFCGAVALLTAANDSAPREHQDLRSQPQQVAPAAELTTTPTNATAAQDPFIKSKSSHYFYHKKRPKGALPPILDPERFADTPYAYVSYSMAERISTLLYQEPCICPCNESEGHQSLRDCYTGEHGRRCGACQSEVIFCYEQHKKGKSPKQIRKALIAKKWIKQDLEKSVNDYRAAITEHKE
jgi:hypothetical protein